MSRIVIFFVDADGKSGSWIVQTERYQHCISVLHHRGSIVTGYEQII